MKRSRFDQQSSGTSVIERMGSKTLSAEVATELDGFKVVHAKLLAAATVVDDKCRQRDAALAAVGAEDAVLDDRVANKLADGLIAAGLSKRTRPFAGFSKYSPSELTGLGFLREVAEVHELVGNVAAKGPSEEVTRILSECLQQAAKVEQAVAEVRPAQHEYDLALAARDEAAQAWAKFFSRLKARAQIYWEDQPEVFKAVFAEPSPVERKPDRRAKKNAKPADEPAEPK